MNNPSNLRCGVSLEDQLRASLAVNEVPTRPAALFAVRAIRTKYRIRTAPEFLTELENLISATDSMHHTALDNFRERLIEACCDLEDEISAESHPGCPALSVSRFARKETA